MNAPSEIAWAYMGIAKGKVSQNLVRTFLLAVLAGVFIAFGGVVSTVASAEFTGTQASLIKGAVFPLGLILVTVCGAELFTGNCLLLAPLLQREIKVGETLKMLAIVYLGNLVGSVLIAALVMLAHSFGTVATEACVNTAAAKCNLSIGNTFVRGILCNMLVCLAVWGAMASKNIGGKILMVYLPVFAFVVCGFEHSVANMYYLSAGLMATLSGVSAEGLNVGNALLNLCFSTLGNIVGGCLIAVFYWAAYLKKPSTKEKTND